MSLFGPLHLTLIAAIAIVSCVLAWVVRRRPGMGRGLRIAIGVFLVVGELGWWVFRYSHEGFRWPFNLPLQLCDVTLWMTALACLTAWRSAAEFAYFAGIGGAGMAVLTPDLWTPWPTYPAVWFFLAHGGIIAGAAVLVLGRVVPVTGRSVWRAFGVLAAFGAAIGAFNTAFGSNYMYLCRKPASASLLDALGPWPWYILFGAAVAVGVFWLLYVPVRLTAPES
jgi:hypothetical integral membrane protein (TIGR02206 family)